jgi:hypothetical protein
LDIGQSRDECAIPFFPLQPLRDWFLPTYNYGYTYPDLVGVDPAVTTTYPMADPYAFNSTVPSKSGSASGDATSAGNLHVTGKTKRTAAKLAREAAAAAATAATTTTISTDTSASTTTSTSTAKSSNPHKNEQSSGTKPSSSNIPPSPASLVNELSHSSVASKKDRQHSKKQKLFHQS